LSLLFETSGGPVQTRTADLYRVKVAKGPKDHDNDAEIVDSRLLRIGQTGTEKPHRATMAHGASSMAVDDPAVVDIVSIDPAGSVILTVADHLEWTETLAHQTVLQAKLNRYLAFIESGEILEKYPKAEGRKMVIHVVMKYRPDAEGVRFLERAGAIIEAAGFGFVHGCSSSTPLDS
jgi:hypothetical protein